MPPRRAGTRTFRSSGGYARSGRADRFRPCDRGLVRGLNEIDALRAHTRRRAVLRTSGSGPPALARVRSSMARLASAPADPASPSVTVVVHDHRGIDRSSHDAIVYSIEQIAGDTLALMDYLHIERTAMVGQSTGRSCRHLAATQQDRISRLVLSSTWTHADPHFTRLFELSVARPRAQRRDRTAHTRGESSYTPRSGCEITTGRWPRRKHARWRAPRLPRS
jgi:pimeloyl-ACP methyl ester carboxylesterase